jgi:phosphoglycerate dehydrogenase-like enzyme
VTTMEAKELNVDRHGHNEAPTEVLLGWHAIPDEVEAVRQALGDQARLRSLPERTHARYGATAEELLAAGADAEVLLTFVLPEAFVEGAQRLRFVSWMHHGYDRIPRALLLERGIQFANLAGKPGALEGSVAEQAWALLLAAAKRLIMKDNAVRNGIWCEQWDPEVAGFEVAGKTVAIVGYGGIGRRVAAVARAFGAHVLAVERRPDADAEGGDEIFAPDELHAILERSHFVVLTVPLTPETYHLIDEHALRAMRTDACLINVARSDLVEERPLYTALTEGWIAAYGTDCWWDYAADHPPGQHFPVPSRLGVHRLPNVVSTGDQSANTLEARERILAGGIDNVRAYFDGTAEERLADLTAGYR